MDSRKSHPCILNCHIPAFCRYLTRPSRSFLIFLSLLALLLASCSGSSPGSTESAPVAEFEGGRLYKAGAVSVLQLHGTHYQMGRQYGMILKDDLKTVYDLTIAMCAPYMTYDRMKLIANNVYARYPQKYKDIIIGMAETSGLGLEKQIVLNALELFVKLNTYIPRCSGIGVWGDYSRDGRMIFGRNNDDAPFFRDFGGYTVVAVFNPTDSGIPVAIVNYAGVIYAPTAINRSGLFMELNSGNNQGIQMDRPLMVVTMFSLLENYSTQAEIDAAFQTLTTDLSAIVNVADPLIAYSFECPLTGVKRRAPDKSGLLASTNHFVDPSWGMPPPEPDSKNGWSVKRRDNLLAFAEANKGKLDADTIKVLLDTGIPEGGVFSESTIFQVVTVPADLTLWLRAPDHFDWQKIDLKPLFY